ncbi:hypothetical protein HK097_007987 [Rhizophlyctis rosea]|uniref:Mitochondrial carrier protein n=1 Tax=Rhizophlyctis rosea TaxID=64517 RepID=A0AAD5SIR7_9FUNG|nr:hypothetical protein HK097_007987 [Rhizophlyctis rosea]
MSTQQEQQPDTSPPPRINLSEMDATRYALFGSLFILAVDSALFPLDTVKTLIMNERGIRKEGVLRMIGRIAKTEGIARFWRGLPPAVLGSFPGQAMYYTAYESAQELLARTVGEKYGFMKGFVADVIRTLLKSEGPKGFYRGYTLYVGAFAPASAVQWGSYEVFKSLFYRVLPPPPPSASSPSSFFSNHRDQIAQCVSGGLAGMCAVCANNPLEGWTGRQPLLEGRSGRDRGSVEGGVEALVRDVWGREGWRGEFFENHCLWAENVVEDLDGMEMKWLAFAFVLIVPLILKFISTIGFYKGLKVRLLVTIPGAMIAMTGYETIKEWSSEGA